MSKERNTELLKKLNWFFSVGYVQAGMRLLPDNYFFIDEILELKEFEGFTVNDVHNAVHSDGKLRFSVRGLKIRMKPPEHNRDPDVIVSKKLTWILRHAAEKEGLRFQSGGFVFVDEIITNDEFIDVSINDILRVVDFSDLQRFELRNDATGRLQIRASQGHSVQIDDLQLIRITIGDSHKFPIVLHGTYLKNWRTIAREGLKRIDRTHIHFAVGDVSVADGEIPGMRRSPEILIYLNLEAALADGIKFYISANNVILSNGDANGVIAPRYFHEVYQRRPRVLLLKNSNGSSSSSNMQ